MDRCDFIRASSVLAAASLTRSALAQGGLEHVPVRIDTRQVVGPLHHVWEECTGSDRAAITIRESWRRDL